MSKKIIYFKKLEKNNIHLDPKFDSTNKIKLPVQNMILTKI